MILNSRSIFHSPNFKLVSIHIYHISIKLKKHTEDQIWINPKCIWLLLCSDFYEFFKLPKSMLGYFWTKQEIVVDKR